MESSMGYVCEKCSEKFLIGFKIAAIDNTSEFYPENCICSKCAVQLPDNTYLKVVTW